MQHDAATWQTKRSIASDPAAGRQVVEEVLAELERQNWIAHDIFSIHLALEEALANAIKHGNGKDSAKQVHVQCAIFAEMIRIQVSDEGPGFTPEEVPDCTAEENLETPSGRGIMLMRNFMSRVEFRQPGNCVILEKEKAPPEGD